MSEGEATRTGAEISDRVHTVIAAAERAAEAIRADAEQQARAQLQEAHARADATTAERMRMIGRLTDDLVSHAASVGERAERLLAGLDEAIAAVEAQLRTMPAPSASAADEEEGPPAAAILRATQLAVSGTDRAQIAKTIGEEFGVDPEPVLAQVLGPG